MHVEFRIIDTLDRRNLEQLASYEAIERKRYESEAIADLREILEDEHEHR